MKFQDLFKFKAKSLKLSHSAENELPKIAKYSISDDVSAIIFNKTTHASILLLLDFFQQKMAHSLFYLSSSFYTKL